MLINNKLHKNKGVFENYIRLQKTTIFDFSEYLPTKDYKIVPRKQL